MSAAPGRYKLTRTQKQALLQTQLACDLARKELAAREAEAQRVSDLIIDACGLPPGTQASFDEATDEIVVVEAK
jgi:hypothetical protein